MSGELRGVVIKLHGLYAQVQTEVGVVLCVQRKKLKHGVRDQKNLIVVGDEVLLSRDGEQGVINEILPRRTLLRRMAADTLKRRKFRTKEKNYKEQLLLANLDQLFLVVSASLPAFSPGFADRILVALEHEHIEPVLVFNKLDLGADAVQSYVEVYRRIGYPVFLVSAQTGEGLDALREQMRGKITAFMGQSGVGKTSLLQRLLPEIVARVQEVSDSTGKGKHTTTTSELFPLEGGGYLADTPGLKEFGLIDIELLELGVLFPEMHEFIGKCRFATCTHLHEPDCAVRQAVGSVIAPFRYESYERIYRELRAVERL